MWLLELGAADTGFGADQDRKHVPGRVEPSVVRAARTRRPLRRSTHSAGRSCACAGQVVSGASASCTSPNAADSSEGSKFHPTSSKMNRLSYSRPSSMRREEAVPASLPRPEELDLRPASPSSKQQAAIGQVVVVYADHAAGARCGDDVAQREGGDRDVGPGAGGGPRSVTRARRRSPPQPQDRARRRWLGCRPSPVRCR